MANSCRAFTVRFVCSVFRVLIHLDERVACGALVVGALGVQAVASTSDATSSVRLLLTLADHRAISQASSACVCLLRGDNSLQPLFQVLTDAMSTVVDSLTSDIAEQVAQSLVEHLVSLSLPASLLASVGLQRLLMRSESKTVAKFLDLLAELAVLSVSPRQQIMQHTLSSALCAAPQQLQATFVERHKTRLTLWQHVPTKLLATLLKGPPASCLMDSCLGAMAEFVQSDQKANENTKAALACASTLLSARMCTKAAPRLWTMVSAWVKEQARSYSTEVRLLHVSQPLIFAQVDVLFIQLCIALLKSCSKTVNAAAVLNGLVALVRKAPKKPSVHMAAAQYFKVCGAVSLAPASQKTVEMYSAKLLFNTAFRL